MSPPDVKNPPDAIPLANFSAKYSSISNLGNGSFGSVELAKHKGGDLMSVAPHKLGTMMEPLVDAVPNSTGLAAIKTMKKKLPKLSDYLRVKEVKFILAIPSHPCLVQIYDIFINDSTFQLHIAMEPMSQNLYQLMKARRATHFSTVTLRSILSQLLAAIQHIHKYDHFHRDVKPENILVIATSQYYGSKDAVPPYRKNDNYVVKLADYGLGRSIHNLKSYTAYVSTRWYRAPEILLRQKWYARPIDVWAFGAVAAEVANFAPLFPGSNELDQIWRTLKVLGSPVPPESHDILPHQLGFEPAPLGGYWNSARDLAGSLGFLFPPADGVRIEDILRNPQQRLLADVIKACLQWDPSSRPTASVLMQMPYFRGSAPKLDNPERLTAASRAVKPMLDAPFLYDENVQRKHHKAPASYASPSNEAKENIVDISPGMKNLPAFLFDDDAPGEELPFDVEGFEDNFTDLNKAYDSDHNNMLEHNVEYSWHFQNEQHGWEAMAAPRNMFQGFEGEVEADISFGSTHEISG